MKKVSITQAKNRPSALIGALKGGSPLLIVDRGRLVTRLEQVIGHEKSGQEGRLSRLLRDGVRPRRSDPSLALLNDRPPRAKTGASAVAALIEERREGR
ncbi:hypothetical protein [Reyranella sp.]|jgi:antitoxin (DNA-binding transcriptional repressor) of toxin-antitoxin stability system|uniref:type II toxin-antitoxin system Phd/YefM family antitoxin n=1 Tax=Reyranella sp. TaxID=1929291 RepID=UPI002F937D7E